MGTGREGDGNWQRSGNWERYNWEVEENKWLPEEGGGGGKWEIRENQEGIRTGRG